MSARKWALLFRMLSENKEREDKYQTIIDRLSGNIEQGIEDIQERLEQLAAKSKNDAAWYRAACAALSNETLGAAFFVKEDQYGNQDICTGHDKLGGSKSNEICEWRNIYVKAFVYVIEVEIRTDFWYAAWI